jgi:hypothetical protein
MAKLRKRLRPVSAKQRSRADEAREVRQALILEVGRCEMCGHNPTNHTAGCVAWRLDAHEILNGPLRQACLDKRHSLLVLCWLCNSEEATDKGKWPEARQLCLLKFKRPWDYDLAAHNLLANPRAPNRITQAEVDAYLEGLR